MTIDYADLPIEAPGQDLFGVDPFVRSLARSLHGMKSPSGIVIALNGPWGSGKSSAINLLKHHLQAPEASSDIHVVNFNPWWFRGEEALVLAFFRELHAAIDPSLGDKAKKLLPKLGARLLKAGSVVAPVADAAGAAGAGAVASGVMGWLSGMIEEGESVEKLHKELSRALAEQSKRFVIVIDDIDRLAPDEALAMFRLVKSVGQLPNLIYILAFDRLLAERVVAEKFPSEGSHYLEKIVQVTFDLPAPLEQDLHQHVLLAIAQTVGGVADEKTVHFMNMFHEIVAPELATPRDTTRYVNALSITWPAVEGEVDAGDFVALEAYRLFQPALYQAIRRQQVLLCDGIAAARNRSDGAEHLDATLLPSVSDKERYRRGLKRLFPKLDAVWGNITHGSGSEERDRRVCSNAHFQTYFRMSIHPDAVSRRELETLIGPSAPAHAISNALRDAVDVQARDGTTRAKALLEALGRHAADIPVDMAATVLGDVFALADWIDVEADEARGFQIGDNPLRIHWLMRGLLMDRTTLQERSRIIMQAAEGAQISWLAQLTESAWVDYHPREGGLPEPESKCLLTEEDAVSLVDRFKAHVQAAAENGSLLKAPSLLRTLFYWLRFEDDRERVRGWLAAQMDDDDALVKLAAALTSYSWTQSGADLVATRKDRASVRGLEDLLDVDLLRAKLTSLPDRLQDQSPECRTVQRFLSAWEKHDQGEGW